MEPQKIPRERVEDLLRLLVPDWRPTAVQVLWAIRITVTVAIGLGVLAIIGYSFGITLWDWLRVLAVPITVGAAVPLLNWLQKKRELELGQSQKEHEQEIENQRAQDEALQAYLDQMSKLLADNERPLHGAKPGDSLSTVARARTLTVLSRLGRDRKRSVAQFLYESGLIRKSTLVIQLHGADLRGVDLRGAIPRYATLREAGWSNATLSEVVLSWANLRNANLSGEDLSNANLQGADLSEADLSDANLSGADLRSAHLFYANLFNANLSNANLSGATLVKVDLSRVNLSDAHLNHATLVEADLSGADLSGADLSSANLSGADLSRASGITNENLERQTFHLEGATMPDGQQYEDWLKSKDREENG